MYHPPSQRKQIIQRTVTYTFMSVAVVALVTMLVFIMLGYQFNRTDGRIEQGGLVQFDSRPSGAGVTIDGTGFGTRTPSKATVGSGQHYITMQRDGYKQWQKSVTVVPGSVLWLNYARLVPSELKQTQVANFKTVSDNSVSPDSKQMAILEQADAPVVQMADLTGDDVKLEKIELPKDSFTAPSHGKTHSFELMKWDSDNRYILAKHVYDDTKTEWLVIDTDNPVASKNVTTSLDIAASKVVFSGNDNKVLYAQTDTDLRRIDLNDSTISGPLVSNVDEFSIYKDSIVTYTTLVDAKTKKRSVGYYNDATEKMHTVRSYTDDGKATLRLAIGEYFSDTYVAVAYGNKVEMRSVDLDNPVMAKPLATVNIKGGAQYLSTMTKGRFVVAQHGETFVVYDMELEKSSSTTLKGAGSVKSQLTWLDNYTTSSDRDGMLRIYEFDGANQHDIMPVVPGFSATFSPNSRYLYGITKTDEGYHLGRVRMVLP